MKWELASNNEEDPIRQSDVCSMFRSYQLTWAEEDKKKGAWQEDEQDNTGLTELTKLTGSKPLVSAQYR